MADAILNLGMRDSFADAEVGDLRATDLKSEDHVHIRIQPRTQRKSITTVEGLPSDLDLKRILCAFKKVFSCNGTIIKDPEMGQVIQLQGDQRQKVADFLINEDVCTVGTVKVHGF